MPQVTVTVNGRAYRLECNDGEERQLLALVGEINRHIDGLRQRVGQVGDDRLMLMAGLMLADELHETRASLEEANAALARIRNDSDAANALHVSTQARIASKIAAAAERIEALSAHLGRDAPSREAPSREAPSREAD